MGIPARMAAGLIVGLWPPALVAAGQAATPDMSSAEFGWMKNSGNYLPPVSGPGPVVSDKSHPYVNIYSPRIADSSNPILKAWVAEALQKRNQEQLAGKGELGLHARCLPGGVPAFLLFGGNINPIYIAQSDHEVLLINQADTQVRHIYLNVPHSANVKPSWYGESVGHYENGDTLVIDTVGLTDRATVDNYETPHTTQMHVVERYTLADGGKLLQVSFTVDDPGAFTMPWSAQMTLRRAQRAEPLTEQPCSENNVDNVTGELYPIPTAAKADF